MSRSIWTKKKVAAETGLHPETLRSLELAGKFPKRFPIIEGGLKVGYYSDEVEAWIAEREKNRDSARPAPRAAIEARALKRKYPTTFRQVRRT